MCLQDPHPFRPYNPHVLAAALLARYRKTRRPIEQHAWSR